MTRRRTARVPPEPLANVVPEPAPPQWVFLGGAALAGIAGFVNAVTLAAGLLPVTHVTGSLSLVTGDVALGDARHAATLAAILLAFIAGAGLSGLLIGDSRLRRGRPYGVVMIIEAALLAASALLLPTAPATATALAAAGSGLQNAMASTYGRLILRTTHMTGIATDIGLLVGRRLRREPAEGWKLGLLTLLLASFTVCGWLGWVAEGRLGARAMFLPAGAVLLLGLGYRAWKRTGD